MACYYLGNALKHLPWEKEMKISKNTICEIYKITKKRKV